MDGIQEINLQMSLIRLVVILVTFYGIQYLSWSLTFLLVVFIFCLYVHIEDELSVQPQTNADFWQKEQIRLDRLIENRFGKKLREDFKLDMNENDEESKIRKCKWVNQLIEATWLQCQDFVEKFIKKQFEDINDNISKRTFSPFFKVHFFFTFPWACIFMALATAEPLVSKHLSTLESRINVALRLIFFKFFLGQNN